MKALHRFIIPCVGVLGLMASGCGDNDFCEDGQTQKDGMCVAAGECGPGTSAGADGVCVPDGSIVCGQGTVFDAESGTCLVDPDQCADGTVFAEGTCIPEDEALEGKADFVEAPEPNDGSTGFAGAFDAPAEGESVSIFGCVEPSGDADGDGNLDADFDAWIITTTGPTVLDLTADGIRGLSAGFVMQNADIANSPALDAWTRFGVNLTGDTSQRQVYLPLAGSYALLMTDSRTLFLDSAGAEDACYFTTITTAPMPAPTSFTVPRQTGTHKSDIVVFNYNADSESDILVTFHDSPSGQYSPGFVVVRNDEFFAVSDGAGSLASMGNLQTAGDEVLLIVDPVFNFALVPQPFVFDSFDIPAQALPRDGTSIELTKRNGQTGVGAADANYMFFDVAAGGSITNFDVVSDLAVGWLVFETEPFETPSGAGNVLGSVPTTAALDEFLRVLAPGRYYLQAFDPAGIDGDTYNVTSTLIETVPNAITYGTPLAAQELPATGRGFHSVDINAAIWSEFNVTGTDLGANVQATLYDLSGQGLIDRGYNAFIRRTVPSDGSAAGGTILRDIDLDFLVMVRPLQDLAVDPATYEVAVGDRDFTDLMDLDEANPITVAADATVGGVARRYLVSTTAGDRITTILTPTGGADGVLRELNRSEVAVATANAGGADAAETLTGLGRPTPADFIAYSVTTDIDSTISLALTSVAPVPYDVAAGALNFADVCGDAGAVEMFAGVDDVLGGTQTLPFAFNHFGLPVTTYRVSSNGWLAFNGFGGTSSDFSPDPIPSANTPNGFFAPFWADLTDATACRVDGADRVTIQWTGVLFADADETIEMQVVIHDDGVVDFVYGNNHLAEGDEPFSMTVGAENIDGVFGHEIFRNEAGIDPGDSYVLTPQ